MDDLEVNSQVFRRLEAASAEEVPAAFGNYVFQNPTRTEYALCAEFLASPGTGFTEVRGIMLDRAGIFRFEDPFRPDAHRGGLARTYAERTGPSHGRRARLDEAGTGCGTQEFRALPFTL